jgi:purine-binding chemotaxis protein CheW
MSEAVINGLHNKIAEQSATSVSEDMIQLVSFNLGEEEFGVDITKVKEINRMVEITRVPNTPEFVIGVINLRGKVIPIINLRHRLGMELVDHDKNTRIVVIEHENKTIGFIVDNVNEVLRISKNITEPPPQMSDNVDTQFITSIGKLEDRLLILLDLEKVIDKGSQLELVEG